jgi:hypothetical protein
MLNKKIQADKDQIFHHCFGGNGTLVNTRAKGQNSALNQESR